MARVGDGRAVRGGQGGDWTLVSTLSLSLTSATPVRDRRRRAVAWLGSAVLTTSLLGLMIAADRMDVVRVPAPQTMISIDGLSMPAPKLAEAPKVADGPQSESPSEQAPAALPERREVDESAEPNPDADLDASPSKRAADVLGKAGGSGMPGVPGLPTGGGGIPGIGTATCPPGQVCKKTGVTAPPGQPPLDLPFSSASCTACPDPSPSELGRTDAARRGLRAKNETRVCFSPSGKATKVTTSRKADPEIDRICRQAVKRWRVEPMKVDGKKRSFCTTVSFDIRFD